MLKFSLGMLLLLGSLSIQATAGAQDADQEGQQAQAREERIQEREARREERRRQIDSLTDEQRQALVERRRLLEARGAAQRGQRPLRRRPPAGTAQPTEQPESEDPA